MRRRAIRHNCKVHIALRLAYQNAQADTWAPEQHPIKGRILDLSPKGCSLFSAQPLDIGQALGLVIVLQSGKKIHTEGSVRWTKHMSKKNGYASGVQLVNLPAKDAKAIEKFLEELDQTAGL